MINISRSLAEWGTKQGFSYVSGILHKQIEGYWITLYEQNNKRVCAVSFAPRDFSETLNGDVLLEVKAGHLPSGVQAKDGALRLVMPIAKSDANEKTLRFIDRSIELLREKEVCGSDHCWYCGEAYGKKEAKRVAVLGALHMVHTGCMDDYRAEAVAAEQSQKKTKSGTRTLVSVLLSAAGMLVGVALWLLAFWLMLIWSAPAFFVAAGAPMLCLIYLGYKLGRGSKAGMWICLAAFSILGVALALALQGLVDMAYAGLPIASDTIAWYYTQPHLYLFGDYIHFGGTSYEYTETYRGTTIVELGLGLLAAVGGFILPLLLELFGKKKLAEDDLSRMEVM